MLPAHEQADDTADGALLNSYILRREIDDSIIMPFSETDTKSDIATDISNLEEEISLYKVILHNDDYTTMEFVVEILMDIFKKAEDEAISIMLHVHHIGYGLCGLYPHEIAETKANAVHRRAMEAGFPLLATVEPA